MNVTIIGVPYDLDQPHTGKGRAPNALLDAGLLDRLAALGHTVAQTEMVGIPDSAAPPVARIGRLMAKLGGRAGSR